MKSLQEIIISNPLFLNNFSSKEDVVNEFAEYNAQDEKENEDNIRSLNILFASYGTDNYSGDAFVLFEKNGKLFEVNAGHCSCYGLEGQWNDNEEVVLEELKNRLINGGLGMDDWSGNVFNTKLKEFLGIEQ